ncbi:UNVERIFIED_CONTAM: Fungalysin/Thermolysin Extracellular metalloproteinase 5 [Siphonaria sp. JEL0065]|nr:Fungalysin/Thermolysin Extracellular metalloproteinase 5 [Siphonaria sp. JEL0065]
MQLATILGTLISVAVALSSSRVSKSSLRHPFGPTQVQPIAEPVRALHAFNVQAQGLESVNAVQRTLSFLEHKNVVATVTDVVPSQRATHVYLVQVVDGIEVANAVGNANVDSAGNIVSFYSSFVDEEKSLTRRSIATEALTSPLQAVDTFFAEIGVHPTSAAGAEQRPYPRIQTRDSSSGSVSPPARPGERPFRLAPDYEIILPVVHNSFAPSTRDEHEISIPATLKYFINEDNELVPVWDIEVDFGNHYYHAHIDARDNQASKKTLGMVDWVSENLFGSEDDDSEVVYERIVERVTYHGKKVAQKLFGSKSLQKASKKHDRPKSNKSQKTHGKKKTHDTITTPEIADGIKGVYNVFPLGTNDPLEGERNLVTGPLSHLASPNGWHWCSGGKIACPDGNYTVTIGNNVFAQENLDGGYNDWENKTRPDGTSKLYFDTPADLTQDPETYVDAAVINLFYWNNAIHDLFYVYGFTEAAGNFQDNNLNRGGSGGDSVIANAQDGSGHNNANFATPPDGTHGRMRMYVWDQTDPWRDGDFEGGIIMHEYAHGISTRLTGGPSNSGCLGFGEAGGMGEGWGDFFATITRMTPENKRDTEFGMGEYANGGSGIRKFKYSTSNQTNPSVYSFVSKPGYWGVHAKGEVWAEILYEVYWNFVDAHGFNTDWFDTTATHPEDDPLSILSNTYTEFRTGRSRTRKEITFPAGSHVRAEDPYYLGGNVLILQLVVDGLKLQPCNPSFVDARDAILTAEDLVTGGKNKCLLWKAFAKRGLGVGAQSGGLDSFKVPKECK